MEGLSPIRFGSVSMVTATLGVNDPKVGDTCRVGDEEYLFVYNAGNSQISKGYGAVVSAVSGYSVTVSSTAGVDYAVGVCMHATLTTGTYGWLVRKGFCNFKATADSVVSAGNGLVLGVDGTWTQPYNVSNVSGTYITVQGKCMVATGSAGTGVGYFSIY